MQSKFVPLTEEERRLLREGHNRTVGEVIREERERKKYGQRELAKLIGISAAQLNRIESGAHRPSRDTLKKISAYLGVAYQELVRLAGFSSLKGDKRWFNKGGEEIYPDQIVGAVYRVDCDLLDELKDFDRYGTDEDVKVLRILLQNMRKEGASEEPGGEENFHVRSFRALKDFILASYN